MPRIQCPNCDAYIDVKQKAEPPKPKPAAKPAEPTKEPEAAPAAEPKKSSLGFVWDDD